MKEPWRVRGLYVYTCGSYVCIGKPYRCCVDKLFVVDMRKYLLRNLAVKNT